MRKNHRLRIGFYSQHSADQLDLDESAVEYLQVRVASQRCFYHLLHCDKDFIIIARHCLLHIPKLRKCM